MKDKELEGKIDKILDKFFVENLVVKEFNPNVDSVQILEQELLELIQKEKEGAIRGFVAYLADKKGIEDGDPGIVVAKLETETYIKQLREGK